MHSLEEQLRGACQTLERARELLARGAGAEPSWRDPWEDAVAAHVVGYHAIMERAVALGQQGRGAEAVEAVVRIVEPAAFRKVSALGVEEQRVNVIADFKAVPPGIGDAYRVDARIVVAEKADALRVPVGALFRRDGKWTIFLLAGGRASARTVA